MSDNDPQPPATSVARPQRRGLLSCFGPLPLLLGEDPNAYNELHAHISGDLKPTDLIEEIWVCELVDIVREWRALRRIKVNVMNCAARGVMAEMLGTLLGESVHWKTAEKLATKWAAGDPRAVAKVDKLFAAAGLTMDALLAKAMPQWTNEVERLDGRIIEANQRYADLLDEIDRHRSTFGQRLRRTVQQVEDAQYHVIEGPKGETKS
jgi:hypothetical protein